MKKNNLWKLAGALALTAVLAGCSSSISQEEATTIALEHAGVAKEEAVQLVLDRVPGASSEDVRIQLEEEDGRQVYEGEVICNRAEHEFEIDAATGDFIQWSVDYQD